jgi:hypothetical protein
MGFDSCTKWCLILGLILVQAAAGGMGQVMCQVHLHIVSLFDAHLVDV